MTKNKDVKPPGKEVQLRYVEVHAGQCRGNVDKMIRRFMKKVKKENVLAPYYERLSHHKTRGQKRREKKLAGAWIAKKEREKQLEAEKLMLR